MNHESMLCAADVFRNCAEGDEYSALKKKLRIERRDKRRGAQGCPLLQHPFALLDVFERLRNSAIVQIHKSISIVATPVTGLCLLGGEELPGDVSELVASFIAPVDLGALRMVSKHTRACVFQEGMIRSVGSRIAANRIRADRVTEPGIGLRPGLELQALVRRHSPNGAYMPQRTWLPFPEVVAALTAQHKDWRGVLMSQDNRTQVEIFRVQFGECEMS
jgi:hypothetical protein